MHADLAADVNIMLTAEYTQGVAGKHAGEDGAQDPAHSMHGEHVQRVINLQTTLEVVGRQEADQTGEYADDQRAGRTDEAGRRRYGAKARNHTRHRTQGARLAETNPLGAHPSERAGRRRYVRNQHGHGGVTICR